MIGRVGARRARAGAVVVATALVTLLLPGVTSADEINSPGQGSITGRVTDENGTPIGPESGICALAGSASDIGSNLRSDGTYRIDRVDVGSYAVRFVQCPTFPEPSVHYAPEFYPNLHDPAAATSSALPNVVVRDRQVTSGIDARLELAGRLDVRVVDTSATPRSGLCVTARQRSAYSGPWNVGGLITEFSGVTGADGKASLVGITPGHYYVVVRSCDWRVVTDPDLTRLQMSGGAFRVEQAATTRVDVGQVASTEVVMARGATIIGRITRDGVPEAGGCAVWSERRGEDLTAVADADGRFIITGITPTLPGVLRGCGADAHSPSISVPMTWYPAAASRWTADSITPVSGGTSVHDIALQPDDTLSVIVTGLSGPSGCSVVATGANGVRRVALRPGPVAGTLVADLFGDASSARSVTLECGGRRVGESRPADHSTPGFETGWTENESWWSPVVEIRYDGTGPVITPSPSPGSLGWSNSPVSFTFTCRDAVSGVVSCPGTVTLGPGQSTTVWSQDTLGNWSSLDVGPAPIDVTPPLILVPGEQRAYRREETLRLGCEVLDGQSGLASQVNQCPVWGTPASALEVGDHEFWVAGTDAVGNVAATIVRISIVK